MEQTNGHKETENIDVTHYNMGTVNKNNVTIRTSKGTVELYFSYRTLVGCNNVVCTNNWGPTTGKLLNELQPDKSQRVSVEEVAQHAQKELNRVLK